MSILRTGTMAATVIGLVACGNLEWPPKSGGAGLDGSQPGLVNGSRIVHQQDPLVPRRVAARLPFENVSAPFQTQHSDREHVVKAGETLSGISQSYNVDVYKMAILNQLEPPFRIYVGQILALPNSAGKPVQLAAFRRREVSVERDIISPAPVGTSVLKAPSPLPPVSPLQVKPGVKPEAAPKPAPARKVAYPPKPRPAIKRSVHTERETALPLVRKGSAFIWPVNGKLVSRFGKKGEGLRNDGVNIVAPRGTAVRAARSGVVAYAGNELRGFGNLLLIKHSNGWVTAYAHNENLLVKRGQRVTRGQVVAKVGDSGNVARPQLHFEIRKGNKAVDPIRQISRVTRRTANRGSGSG